MRAAGAAAAVGLLLCGGTAVAKPRPGGAESKHADPYADIVEKAMGTMGGAPEHLDPAGIDTVADSYQGRPQYGDVEPVDKEPALTAEDALMYADQEQPDWEPYGGNEAEGELRDQDFDEEYKRYLDEMKEEMKNDPAVAADIVQSLQQIEADGGELESHDIAILKLAMRFQQEARTRLDEQEREILNRQRRERKHQMHRDEGLGPERAGQFGFNDPGDPFWQDEQMGEDAHRRLKEIVHNRARVLHNVDRRRKEAFLQHEMERLLEYRELVQRTADPKVRDALIAAHAAEQLALSKAHHAEPGKEKELRAVWEDQGLDPDTFDPKTMFHMQDTNEDQMLDEKEVEAMHLHAAEQMHARTHGEAVDTAAIAEEAARMREHMMNQMDTNGDRLISMDEFMIAAKKSAFKEDKGWDPVNAEAEAAEKLKQFERHRREVLQTGHKQADPALLKVAEKALGGADAVIKAARKPGAKRNPFGKLVDKMGGEKSGWGKIAKHFGEPKKRKKPEEPTPRAVQVKKDV